MYMYDVEEDILQFFTYYICSKSVLHTVLCTLSLEFGVYFIIYYAYM